MELICRPLVNGIMACWEKVEDAASYTVTLLRHNFMDTH